MKHTFRVLTATMLVLAFAAVATFTFTASADAAPEFENNLTAGATATAPYWNNEDKRDAEGAIDGIIDGSIDNYWQPASGDSNTLTIEWSAAQTFDTIVVRWKPGSKTVFDGISVGGEAVDVDVKNYDNDVDVVYINSATSTSVGVSVSGTFNTGCGNYPGEIVEIEVYNTNHGEVIGGGNNDDQQPGGGADTGVASTLAFAVVAMSAAGVAFVSKKKA